MKKSITLKHRKTLFKPLLVGLGALLFLACNQPATEPTAVPTTPPTATATAIPPTPTPEPTATPEPTVTPIPTVPAASNAQPGVTEMPTSAAALDITVSPGELSEEDAFVQQLFENAALAILDVDSFHFEMEATIEADGGGSLTQGGIPISLVGDFQTPDRLQVKMEVSLGFFAFEMETISIGDTAYVTDPQTGEWQLSEGQSMGFPNPAELTGFDGEALEGLSLIGEEILDGVPVYHLQGSPPDDAFSSSGDNSVQADFWIGVEDSLFRQIKAVGDISLEDGDDLFGGTLGGAGGASGDSAELELTMTFSNYNEPITIEPPEL